VDVWGAKCGSLHAFAPHPRTAGCWFQALTATPVTEQVWASKWNDRAWLSRRARGVPDSALYMAALIQQVRSLSLQCSVPMWCADFTHEAVSVCGTVGQQPIADARQG
jgi:Pyruvate phosphate dikinase, AMP/ATP-binding domain